MRKAVQAQILADPEDFMERDASHGVQALGCRQSGEELTYLLSGL